MIRGLPWWKISNRFDSPEPVPIEFKTLFTGIQITALSEGYGVLILAPESYYQKYGSTLATCELLLESLKQRTRARVAFGTSDFLAEDQIKIVAQNWLVKPLKA